IETQQNMELLQKAIATLNYDEIQHLAHKMKTMGKQIAAKNVVPLLYEFDSPHVNELAIETLTQMYSKLEIEFQNLFEAINKRQGSYLLLLVRSKASIIVCFSYSSLECIKTSFLMLGTNSSSVCWTSLGITSKGIIVSSVNNTDRLMMFLSSRRLPGQA